MRINSPPPPAFPSIESGDVRGVDRVRPVRGVEGEMGRAVVERREQPAGPVEYRPAPGQPGFVETRIRERRQQNRRSRSLPVVMDTRTGTDRRRQARRASDEAPPRIDVTA
ncbi:MAG: hypothetical protein ACK5YW_15870 [Betaproteobacteria bacterium]|jgi:hypothetical protein|nr:hypothetical protein [Rhodocyclaceae bacterium]MCA3133590.1 hypothetical protein [Rhodocyclaceae bacterium]MCA3141519.1 hypothetical protein [Rhodocyclaceae bacterium]MCA3145855.1 hypothetical protein [Rhodocyclaceae bacterium]MCE2897108.1 hypothetical protein [Betaproteobacteria bacterium]